MNPTPKPTYQDTRKRETEPNRNTIPDWRETLKSQVRVDAGQWPDIYRHPEYRPEAENLFALRAPAAFLRDAPDALLKQILPSAQELTDTETQTDAVNDSGHTVAPGVIHKYKGRVLLIANGLCAINCRYCFRRHFPYTQHYASHNNWQASIDYLTNHQDVHEVILSGGDPLTLGTNRLRALTNQLAALPWIRTLRIHTRVPVVLPQRITGNLLQWLHDLPLHKVLVTHINHSAELTGEHHRIFEALRQAGTILLNQSVLLKGINDSARTLVSLSHRLFSYGILPYYLHQLDRVQGVSHFAVSDSQALAIHAKLQAALPGYLVPKLVQEIPRKPAKTLLF